MSAFRKWVSTVAWRTPAAGVVVDHKTLGIVTTVVLAGINTLLVDAGQKGRTMSIEDTLWPAVTEGVSGVARGTMTDGDVVGNMTPGIDTTGPWAGVNTLLVDTGSLLVTVRADHTLWPTVGRVALISRYAVADTNSVLLPMLTVGSAGVGVTRVIND